MNQATAQTVHNGVRVRESFTQIGFVRPTIIAQVVRHLYGIPLLPALATYEGVTTGRVISERVNHF